MLCDVAYDMQRPPGLALVGQQAPGAGSQLLGLDSCWARAGAADGPAERCREGGGSRVDGHGTLRSTPWLGTTVIVFVPMPDNRDLGQPGCRWHLYASSDTTGMAVCKGQLLQERDCTTATISETAKGPNQHIPHLVALACTLSTPQGRTALWDSLHTLWGALVSCMLCRSVAVPTVSTKGVLKGWLCLADA